MKKRHAYIGILNGISGVFCDQKPEGIELKDTITFYSADEGKVFVDKEGNLLDSVVIEEGVDIKDYVEIKGPRQTEEETQDE